MRIDLHTHSSLSDGTDTPSELVAAAATAGLDVVALCDHDTFDGLAEATVAGSALGVRVLRGIEMSAQHHWSSVHLLGYGCRADDEALAAGLGGKRAVMADPAAAERSSGYVVGGISPLGQRTPLTTAGR